MLQLTNLTSDPRQQFTIIGENGEIIPTYLFYCPTQIGWFMNISYGNFVANGLRLVATPNMLFQWKNIIPFGLMCVSNDGYDPFYLDDFTTGRIKIYLLNSTDVPIFETP